MQAIIGVLLAIPGLGVFLERIGLAGGAYLKGRVDQSGRDRLAAAEAELRDRRRGQQVAEAVRRLAPDERRRRLRKWARDDLGARE